MYAKITIQAPREICMATSGVEWRLLALPIDHVLPERGKMRHAMSEAMGQAYNTKLQMRGQFLLI
jgi:hypothetical protein